MSYLLDTNVLSQLARPRRDDAVGARRYPRPFVDGQVAVTNGLRLATRNVADFAGFADLAVESWWSVG